MIRRVVPIIGIAGFITLGVAPSSELTAQSVAGATGQTQAIAPRAIRRDVPITNTIRRAFDAGTRDSTGRPGPNYWQLQTDFVINAKLDPATQTITGTETITVHNNSPQDLTSISLRLDHNIFRANVPRGSWVPAEITDGMVLTSLAVNDEAVDLTPAAAGGRGGAAGGQRRTSVTGLDQTIARILLGTPIAAKSTGKLEIGWHTKLPGGTGGRGHRTTQRWDDTLFQPTQWYPRLAKYDDLRGWNTTPYLGPSEFYNNFGRFDVRIDVPGGWIVSGTGVLQNPQEVLTTAARERLARVTASDETITIVDANEPKTAAGDRLVWHFVADLVNDFAWATSKNYVWKATRATIPGKGPVPINIVHLPERAKFFANIGPITRHALEFYSKLWTPYPFPQFTVQDGPSNGMEYPMVINSNDGPADHETGHQWWPMMVGNNETFYGWMDEGFNQYMNILSEADSDKRPASLNLEGLSYGAMSGNEDEPPMMWNANYGGTLYEFQTYGKTPMMLSMLGGIVGDDAVQKAMSEYAKTWAFKHPSPWDYIFFMNNALNQDLGWFWYYWLWTTESVDGAIERVTANGARATVTVRQHGQMPSPVVLKVQLEPSGPAIKPMPNAKMVNETTAIVTWPVDVWFNGNRTFDAALDFGGRAITNIMLDPGCRFPDKTPADNFWPKPATPPTMQAMPKLCGG